ncbi:hypothetical protein A2U01_0065723 [Trifolium medium]|uniref:Uncharacterized protein n=1 Tax=Trifolium medium TaxID=97028 RepID=A0A392S8H8_9FABA|nr:hypothetical protein [Trifolium medium]
MYSRVAALSLIDHPPSHREPANYAEIYNNLEQKNSALRLAPNKTRLLLLPAEPLLIAAPPVQIF